MTLLLKEKIVLITGGSEGYGKAMAEKFYKNGCHVIITGRNAEKLENAKKSIGNIECFPADVAKSEDWEKLRQHLTDKYKKIDILINNAGGGISIKDTTDQTIEDIDSIIKLNLNGAIYGSRIFGRMMKLQKSGIIINISSACAKEAWPQWTVYAAAKAGLLAFSKGLYLELQPYNVRVTCLIPGAGASSFLNNCNLPEHDFKLTSNDIGQIVFDVCALPEHVVVEEMTVWGIDQEVVPL